ncbi:MAG: S9 family peptidase [Bacteroidales bacterium]|nr:S9 family peptidase [Candidatus Sodaliphilus aphodohippi]
MKQLIMSTILLAGAAMATQAQNIKYPDTRRVDTVDVYFGTKVADPYRWLEDDHSAETAQWVKEQNAITNNYLQHIPCRKDVKKRLTELFNYEKMGIPFKVKGKYYIYKNDGLQNQSVLYVKDKLDGEARVVLDPNKLSDDGTVALYSVDFSNDGRYLAYTITRNGSDWCEIYVLDLTTGKTLEDHIMWAKFTGAQWLGDGFFYSCYDAPESELTSKNECQKVCYHKLGTPQSEDYLEYCDKSQPQMFYMSMVDDNERFIFLTECPGEGNGLFVKDLKDRNPHYVRIAPTDNSTNEVVGIDDNRIYIKTNKNAPQWKIVAYDINHLGLNNTDFIPESDAVIAGAQQASDKFIINYERDASTQLAIFDRNGTKTGEIALPAIGAVGLWSDDKNTEVFYNFTNFTTPGTIYSYDMATNTSKQLFAPRVAFNPADFETEQVFFTSKDGTRVPMFLVHKKGLKRDGKRPVLIYGYGGFNISMTPGFSTSRIPLLEADGIYAVVNLRGGSEYGEKWHEAGTKMKKQNVFDDFISAAEYLIKEGYTAAGKIACNGGSNGGLLVGAVVNQRPDLYGAAVPQVGVMDMLRYHRFTVGWNWASDYGRSDDSKEMFEYLRSYSPLHTIKNDGTKYPPILVTSADHDDRVVPAHSFKYAATLQASNTGNAVKIIRIDSNAGHGHGKPVAKAIEESADIMSFVLHNLGVKYRYKKQK